MTPRSSGRRSGTSSNSGKRSSRAIDAGKSLDDIKREIDLPFYKEWTGVDVKKNTENIDHVYGELTGARKKAK